MEEKKVDQRREKNEVRVEEKKVEERREKKEVGGSEE